MSKKVLLVGCGQIGSRHLQALSCLKEIGEIHVVDINKDNLSLGQKRVEEVTDRNKSIKYHWATKCEPSGNMGDLCIVATSAKGRVRLLQDLVSLGYSHFILEKLVCQSMQEYDRLWDLAKQNDLKVWVHCQTRTYAIHKYIKSKLNLKDPVILSEVAGNLGLVCNGIHYADLFLYYDETDRIIPVGESIHPILHPSKRGSDMYDLSGTMTGYSIKGSQFLVAYDSAGHRGEIFSLASSKGQFVVDHINERAFENLDGNWKEIPFGGSTRVSQTTKYIALDILTKGSCDLPTLKEAYASHEFIINRLKPHFEKLLELKSELCPAT